MALPVNDRLDSGVLDRNNEQIYLRANDLSLTINVPFNSDIIPDITVQTDDSVGIVNKRYYVVAKPINLLRRAKEIAINTFSKKTSRNNSAR